MHIVKVDLGKRAYPILIGSGIRAELADLIRGFGDVARIAVVADCQVADLHLERLLATLELETVVFTFDPGEQSKTLERAGELYDGLARARLGRRDLVITLGGGVASDLGGFVAATWLRGVRFVALPTTLEAAIDASFGGKTGLNHPAGKNLIGAFHQPAAVVVDTDFLSTLPQRDFVAGLAESIKHAALCDAAFFEWHRDHARQILDRVPGVIEELVARNCRIKADVVVRDELEDNLRMILNHGHTIGHAVEHLFGYELRHGECVALGMLVENELACARGLLGRPTAELIAELLDRLGLPRRLPRRLEGSEVAAACRMDKKVRGGRVNFVLLEGLGVPKCFSDISEREIGAAISVVQPG